MIESVVTLIMSKDDKVIDAEFFPLKEQYCSLCSQKDACNMQGCVALRDLQSVRSALKTLVFHKDTVILTLRTRIRELLHQLSQLTPDENLSDVELQGWIKKFQEACDMNSTSSCSGFGIEWMRHLLAALASEQRKAASLLADKELLLRALRADGYFIFTEDDELLAPVHGVDRPSTNGPI